MHHVTAVPVLIGELAARSGSSRRSLRYYEARGLLLPERDPNGYRVYAADSVLRARQIRALLDAGFGVEVIAVLLPCARDERPVLDLCPDVVATMERVLRSIDDELLVLHGQRARVEHLLGEGHPYQESFSL